MIDIKRLLLLLASLYNGMASFDMDDPTGKSEFINTHSHWMKFRYMRNLTTLPKKR